MSDDASRPAVFFDRDNTLIVGADYLGDPAEVVLMTDAANCVAGVRRLGYAVVTASNQSGVARGYYTEADVHAVNARMDELLAAENPEAIIDGHEFCPHHPEAEGEYGTDCDCRKPKAGLLQRAAETLGLDLSRSWMVGDAPRDIEAGAAVGCRTILLSVPDLEASPAASAEERVAPDFRAANLEAVLEIIIRETPTPATTSTSAAAPTSPAATSTTAEEDSPVRRVSDATDRILADLRRSREAPQEEFNALRLLAGATQVLALAAMAWAFISDGDAPNLTALLSAIFLQLLTITLLLGAR